MIISPHFAVFLQYRTLKIAGIGIMASAHTCSTRSAFQGIVDLEPVESFRFSVKHEP